MAIVTSLKYQSWLSLRKVQGFNQRGRFAGKLCIKAFEWCSPQLSPIIRKVVKTHFGDAAGLRNITVDCAGKDQKDMSTKIAMTAFMQYPADDNDLCTLKATNRDADGCLFYGFSSRLRYNIEFNIQ